MPLQENDQDRCPPDRAPTVARSAAGMLIRGGRCHLSPGSMDCHERTT